MRLRLAGKDGTEMELGEGEPTRTITGSTTAIPLLRPCRLCGQHEAMTISRRDGLCWDCYCTVRNEEQAAWRARDAATARWWDESPCSHPSVVVVHRGYGRHDELVCLACGARREG